jgi:acetyl-CoA carboxylase carboxyl transferase subunit alpha
MIFTDFIELHGDRRFGDDRAIVTGLCRLDDHKVMAVAQHKGRETKEKMTANFGMPRPEGYRKALQKMKLAEKFGLPVVCLIDTAGAYPGVGSEERGVAEAIAVNLRGMSKLRTPILCAIIGEGGSGGALGIAVGDRVAMMQYAWYSVISPENCSAILWRDGDHTEIAAENLCLTAKDNLKRRIIDAVIDEPLGGAHRDPDNAAAQLEEWIIRTIRELNRYKIDNLVRRRYERWRKLGEVSEPVEAG